MEDETPESAQARIAELRNDKAWTAEYVNGDQAKRAEFTRLHDVAFGTASVVDDGVVDDRPAPAAREQPPPEKPIHSAGDEPVSKDGVLHPGMPGFDEANAELFAGPRGPWEYQLGLINPNQTEAETAQAMAVHQGLFDAGVPVFLAHALQNIAKRNETLFIHGAPEARIARGTAELERRHGADAARIIADAQAAFERIDARSPAVADVLCNSTLGSDPDAIEALARWQRASAKRKT